MAGKVNITKDGLLAEEPVTNVLALLRCYCEIEHGVTLADIFRAVAQHPDLMAFLRAWSWCDVEAFHQEAQTPANKPSGLFHIEIFKEFEWGEEWSEQAIRVKGIGEPYGQGRSTYGIDLTPVNELVDLPVRLRPRMEILNESGKVADAPCRFTLLEVLGEIYWEISFFGSPSSRDEKLVELEGTAREIKEGRAALSPLKLNKKGLV